MKGPIFYFRSFSPIQYPRTKHGDDTQNSVDDYTKNIYNQQPARFCTDDKAEKSFISISADNRRPQMQRG